MVWNPETVTALIARPRSTASNVILKIYEPTITIGSGSEDQPLALLIG